MSIADDALVPTGDQAPAADRISDEDVDPVAATCAQEMKILNAHNLQPLATQHILGVTSLWLLLPVFMGVRTSLLTADWFGWLRLVTLVCTTLVSVLYWGYFNDESSVVLHLDMNLARLTAILHLIYALRLSLPYALVGVVGTITVTLLYTASYHASKRRSAWSVKVAYHLLFRYVGFWEVFILHSRSAITSPSGWCAVFVVASVAYFGHAYVVFTTFSPAIGYEWRLVVLSLVVVCTGAFTTAVK